MIENPKAELEFCLHELDKALEAIQNKVEYQRDAIAKGKLYRLSELQLHEAQVQKLIGRIQVLQELVEGKQ